MGGTGSAYLPGRQPNIGGLAIRTRVAAAHDGTGMPPEVMNMVTRDLERARDRADELVAEAQSMLDTARRLMETARQEQMAVHVLVDHVTGRAQEQNMQSALLAQLERSKVAQPGASRPGVLVGYPKPNDIPPAEHVPHAQPGDTVLSMGSNGLLADPSGFVHEQTPSGRHDPELCRTCDPKNPGVKS